MIFNGALLGALLLVGHSSARTHAHALLRRSHDFEQRLSRDASIAATLTRRQDANPADTESAPRLSTTPASGDGPLDFAKWERETKIACDTAISQLNGASNPTGLAVCYNLPFLDNRTGTFQAELRLYNVSEPQDPWRGVTAADINLALTFDAAQLQNMDGEFTKRDSITWTPIGARNEDSLLVKRQDNGGVLNQLKVLMYVGRINDNAMGTAMNEESLRPLLTPRITLSARNGELTTGLASDEATFINGVFAEAGTPVTDLEAARASASAAIKEEIPFVLPGTRLAFFPVGLVITCVWTAFFFLAVGLGTFGRIQFREQYRRRMKREMATGVRTI